MKTLFIDACPRTNSRTRKLAEVLLQKIPGDMERLVLANEHFPDLDDKGIIDRNEDCKTGEFCDPKYEYAKKFADADNIIIAAPFWDLSFPAILKKYIETISVVGITFRYSEEGVPVGLCKAKKLIYVTTAGGRILNDEFGYGYIKALATGMYGIPECVMYKAENLDVYGNDADQIIKTAAEAIENME